MCVHFFLGRIHLSASQRESLTRISEVDVRSFSDMQHTRFSPWVGKITGRWKRQPTPIFFPGEFHRQRSLADYSPQGHEESDMTERLTHKLRLDFVLQSAVLICQASLPFFLVIAPPLWLGNRETFLWIPQWCLKIFSFHLLLNPEKVILELSALFPHTTPLWRSLPRGARTAGKSGSTQIFWGQLQPSLPPFHPSTEEVTTVVWRRKRWDGPYRTQGCKAWFGRTDFWSCTEGMNSGASRISPGGSLSKACTARRAEAQG